MTKGYALQGGSAVKICPVEITEPGTYYAEEGEAFNPVKVDVSGGLEEKEVTITGNGTTTVSPTEGKIGMSSVRILVSVPPYAVFLLRRTVRGREIRRI